MDATESVRYTNTVLYDDNLNKHLGDVILHPDGSWSNSVGDEDVIKTVDGKNRLITRESPKLAYSPCYATQCERLLRRISPS